MLTSIYSKIDRYENTQDLLVNPETYGLVQM